MFKKEKIKQDTILGVAAILFMAVLFLVSWIENSVAPRIYKRRAGK